LPYGRQFNLLLCRQTGVEGKERLAEVSVLRHAMQCIAVTVAQARVQLLRCIWCIIGCYLRHRACFEHAKVQSASGRQHKSAGTVALYTVSVVQICDAKCE